MYTDLPAKKHIFSEEQIQFIDEVMVENDELTARQFHTLLDTRWPHLMVSLSTIKRAKRKLGWVASRPKYCQLVREKNQIGVLRGWLSMTPISFLYTSVVSTMVGYALEKEDTLGSVSPS